MSTDYRFSMAIDDVDRGLVHRWLSEEAYWAKGRPRQVQDAAIDARPATTAFSRWEADGRSATPAWSPTR